jgi:hypothetical protein
MSVTTTWSLAKELGWPADDIQKYAKEMARRDGYDTVFTRAPNSKGKWVSTLTPRAVSSICSRVAAWQDPVGQLIRKTNVVFVRAPDLAQILNVDIDVIDKLAGQVLDRDGVQAAYVMADDDEGFSEWELTPHAARCIEMAVRIGRLS